MVIPPLVNNFIGVFKDTSLVIIIGLFDLLGTANPALADPNGRAFAAEAYIFDAVDLFLLLLLHVALQPVPGGRAQQGDAPLMATAARERSKARPCR